MDRYSFTDRPGLPGGLVVSKAVTFVDTLVGALKRASAYNAQDQVSPAAVMWTDRDRQRERLMPRLPERLPLFFFGPYAPEERPGPAYWLRCIIARTILDPALRPHQVPVLYPGRPPLLWKPSTGSGAAGSGPA